MRVLFLILCIQAQAQTDWCDSLYYYTLPSPVFSVVGMTTDSLANSSDTVSWSWTVCNTSLCFSESGTYASFPLVQPTDTLKVCYNAYIMNIPNPTISCYERCDSLIYNGNQWVLLGSGGTVGVTEIPLRPTNNIYNLKGVKLLQAPKNKMYIKNRKLYYELCD